MRSCSSNITLVRSYCGISKEVDILWISCRTSGHLIRFSVNTGSINTHGDTWLMKLIQRRPSGPASNIDKLYTWASPNGGLQTFGILAAYRTTIPDIQTHKETAMKKTPNSVSQGDPQSTSPKPHRPPLPQTPKHQKTKQKKTLSDRWGPLSRQYHIPDTQLMRIAMRIQQLTRPRGSPMYLALNPVIQKNTICLIIICRISLQSHSNPLRISHYVSY